jgi:hypothetical protein
VLQASLPDKCHCEPVFGEAISRLTVFASSLEIATPPKNHRRLATTSFNKFCPVENYKQSFYQCLSSHVCFL